MKQHFFLLLLMDAIYLFNAASAQLFSLTPLSFFLFFLGGPADTTY